MKTKISTLAILLSAMYVAAQDPATALADAQKAYVGGNWKDAAAAYEKACPLQPKEKQTECLLWNVLALSQTGEAASFKKAGKRLDSLVQKVNPQEDIYADLMMTSAQFRLYLGKYDKAAEDLIHAIETSKPHHNVVLQKVCGAVKAKVHNENLVERCESLKNPQPVEQAPAQVAPVQTAAAQTVAPAPEQTAAAPAQTVAPAQTAAPAVPAQPAAKVEEKAAPAQPAEKPVEKVAVPASSSAAAQPVVQQAAAPATPAPAIAPSSSSVAAAPAQPATQPAEKPAEKAAAQPAAQTATVQPATPAAQPAAKAEEKTAAAPAPAVKAEPAAVSEPYWVLQLGAFGVKNNADLLVSNLKKRKIQANIVEQPRGEKVLYLVQTGHFATKDAAVDYGAKQLAPLKVEFQPLFRK